MPIDTELLPDHVWQQLDPLAGRLTPVARRQARRWAIAALALLIAGVVAWQSGVLVPHVVRGNAGGNGWSANSQARQVTTTVEIRNDGWQSLRVTGVGRSGPGMTLRSVNMAFPVEVQPSTSVQVTLSYDITDCAAVPRGRWPVPVRVQRPWGTFTSWVDLERGIPPVTPTPHGLFNSGPYEQEWQALLAITACTPPETSPTPAAAGQ
ncbi:MAG: hypothetical protein QOG52_1813 [Frankiaceae bacterium]|jgi:hypothetical protein|nr:hypothetical protein [Frankiaceae bacterium]